MFGFITNLFKPMNSEPENTFPLDPQGQTVNQDGPTDSVTATYVSYDELDLISSVLREVVYLYTQTGAGISSELQERIRQAQELLEH